MSDIEQSNQLPSLPEQPSSSPTEASKKEAYQDKVGTVSRVAALGTGAACIASGLVLSFQGADPSVLHTVFIAGTTLFGLAISGKLFSKE
ncbi:MAG: hypothetical protein EAZ92_11830 [Candidatus Kapaibacterium sp.]|nr:MAG: hypothetical protein EAZ92_11830 [Candidatus Kapabacteria bacterium]